MVESNEWYLLHIFALNSFSLLQSSCYKFHVYFRNFCYITNTQVSSLKREGEINCQNCGTQTRKKTFFHCKRRVFQLGQFNLLSVPISQQLPVLPLFNFWLFLIDRCNLTALFVDNSQVLLNNKPLLKAGNYPLASKKRQSSLTLQIWTVRRHVVLISSYVVQSVG